MKLTGHPTIRLKLLLLLSLALLPLICCAFLLCRKMLGLKSTERTDIQMQLDDHVKVHVVYTELLPFVARTHFLSGCNNLCSSIGSAFRPSHASCHPMLAGQIISNSQPLEDKIRWSR